MSKLNCSFCSNKGIPGPHDHSIRDFTKNNYPIICPQLLAIECGYCHENGHTVSYCLNLKKKKLSSDSEKTSSIYMPKISSFKKRTAIIDCDGFICSHSLNHVQKPNIATSSFKIQKLNNLNNAFSSLDVDEPSDDKIDPSPKPLEGFNLKKYMVWADHL